MELLDGLPEDIIKSHAEVQSNRQVGLTDVDHTTRWLLSRQTALLEDDEEDDDVVVEVDHELQWAGFNGRPNKIADTCYSWWVCGSLAVSI